MIDTLPNSGLLDRRQGVTAADDSEAGSICHAPGDSQRSVRKRRPFEYAHRSVPEYGSRARDLAAIAADGARSDVEDRLATRYVVNRSDRCRSPVRGLSNDDIDGREQQDSA